MKKTVALWIIASAAVLAFGLWRYRKPPLLRAEVVLVYDRSDSMPQDCDSVVALGQRALSLPSVRENSTLTFFATGDQSTHFEPVLVASYSLPVTRLVTEGNKRLADRQQAFLEDLRKRCAALPPTAVSPIVQAINRALAHLTSLGDEKSVRYLIVRSDLEETTDAAVKRALAQGASAPTRAPTLDNAGVNIVLCGSAELTGPDYRHSSERIKEVWTGLFTQPDQLRFEPYCSHRAVQLGSSE